MADPSIPRATRSQTSTPRAAAPDPVLCANNCGFFGRADQRDLCSKCYKEITEREQQQGSPVVAPSEPAANLLIPPAQLGSDTTISLTSSEDGSNDGKDNPKKRVRHRCGVCRKKLRLAQQFECLCEEVFCGEHRYGDAHDCQFDYIKRNQEQLRKDNPEVIASKISKI